MREKWRGFLVSLLLFLCLLILNNSSPVNSGATEILSYMVDPATQDIRFFWRDDDDRNYASFERLRLSLENKNITLTFAMNGGMYLKDGTPQGLYIEEGVTKRQTDTTEIGYGNFYMQPNGIFYLTFNKTAGVCSTKEFPSSNVRFATQSGPMLVVNGDIHPKFMEGSTNLHIRNGVGVLPDGRILFAMSKKEINFHSFATYFKNQGCENALYLDGFVSRTYLPSKNWIQTDGNFGVIIAEIENN